MLGYYANRMISEHTRVNVHKPPFSQNNHQSKADLIFTYLKPPETNLMVYNSPNFLQFLLSVSKTAANSHGLFSLHP